MSWYPRVCGITPPKGGVFSSGKLKVTQNWIYKAPRIVDSRFGGGCGRSFNFGQGRELFSVGPSGHFDKGDGRVTDFGSSAFSRPAQKYEVYMTRITWNKKVSENPIGRGEGHLQQGRRQQCESCGGSACWSSAVKKPCAGDVCGVPPNVFD